VNVAGYEYVQAIPTDDCIASTIEAIHLAASELPMAKLDAVTTLDPAFKIKKLSQKIWPERGQGCARRERVRRTSDFTGSLAYSLNAFGFACKKGTAIRRKLPRMRPRWENSSPLTP
jgi:hypothetical protein